MPNSNADKKNNTRNKRFYFNPEVFKRRQDKKIRSSQTETFKEKEIVGRNTGYKGIIYTCPLTNQNFKGGCPIIPCHANTTKYNAEKSCCMHIETGKYEFDRWDVQEQFNIKESKLYKLKDLGEKRSKTILLFNEILNGLRSKNEENLVPKDFSETANFIHHSYLSVGEINGRHSDVELIKRNIENIKRLLKQYNSNLSIFELIGLEKPSLLPEG